jgi:hypothetical protein
MASLEPRNGQHFALLQVPSKELTDHILKLTVIDAGKAKRRSVIGYVTFPLRDLPAENEQILYKMDLEKVGSGLRVADVHILTFTFFVKSLRDR